MGHSAQFDQNHKLFLGLDEDGLLKPFRQREGLPAPGPDLGGWYDNGDDFTKKIISMRLSRGIRSANTFQAWRGLTQ